MIASEREGWRQGDRDTEGRNVGKTANWIITIRIPFCLSWWLFAVAILSHTLNNTPKGHPAMIMVMALSRTNSELARGLQSAASKTRHTITYTACHL